MAHLLRWPMLCYKYLTHSEYITLVCLQLHTFKWWSCPWTFFENTEMNLLRCNSLVSLTFSGSLICLIYICSLRHRTKSTIAIWLDGGGVDVGKPDKPCVWIANIKGGHGVRIVWMQIIWADTLLLDSQLDWFFGVRCSSVECHKVLLSLFPRYNSISSWFSSW